MPNLQRLIVLLSLCVAHAAQAQSPVEARPGGDGATLLIDLHNRAVHEVPVTVGVGERVISQPLGGYSDRRFFAQCAGDALPLAASVADDSSPLKAPELSFDGGPPALWITSARAGRAALERLVVSADGAQRVLALTPEALPPTFAGLRFAPLILMDIAEFGALPAAKRTVVLDATAAGSVLVLSAGASGGEAITEGAVGLRVGPAEKPGPGLQRALGRVAGRRSLVSAAAGSEPAAGQDTFRTTVQADQSPLVLERAYGLGLVRAVGVAFEHLDAGPTVSRLFNTEGRGLEHALDWLALSPPTASAGQVPLSPWIWGWLLGLCVLAMAARRWPRFALALALPWAIAGATVSPAPDTATPQDLRALSVAVGDRVIQVATVDIRLGRGGVHGLPVSEGWHLSLDDTAPGGACLIGDGTVEQVVVSGDPADVRRLTTFAIGPKVTPGQQTREHLPASGGGRLSGAPLWQQPSGSPQALPAAVGAQLWHTVAQPSGGSAPLVLE